MKLLLYILTLFFSISASAQYAIRYSPIDSNILVYTSYGDVGNYKKIDANAVIVISGNDAILFDTPWDDEQAKQLITYVQDSLKKEIKLCIITHAHIDRIGSIEIMHHNNIPTYCYQLTAKEASKNNHPTPKNVFAGIDTNFVCGDINITAFYPGAGHTVDNIILYIPSKKFLYGGCFIKSGFSKSIGNIADADVKQWAKSVMNMKEKLLLNKKALVIPGHGNWESKSAVDNTLRLIREYNSKH